MPHVVADGARRAPSLLWCLRKREAGLSREPHVSVPGDRFRDFGLLVQHSVAPAAAPAERAAELRQGAAGAGVSDIVAAAGLVLVVTAGGTCDAYDRATMRHLCALHSDPAAVVCSLYYNRLAGDIMLVSVARLAGEHDETGAVQTTLRCDAVPLECVRRGRAGPLRELVSSLAFPSFVEFDDLNDVMLVFCTTQRRLDIINLSDYSTRFSLYMEPNEVDFKLAHGLLMLTQVGCGGEDVPVNLVDLRNGELVAELNLNIDREEYGGLVMTELFYERMLVQQERGPLQMINMRTGESTSVEDSALSPGARRTLILLHSRHQFLLFDGKRFRLYNCQGELVLRYEHHELLTPDADKVYVTADQAAIISVAPLTSFHSTLATIKVSDIMSGRCSCVAASDHTASPGLSQWRHYKRIREALQDFSALYFDEEANELYTGNSRGMLYIWG